MLFNSVEFALFFPVVTAGYFLLPHRARWAWLLAASVYFYMCFVPKYVLILAGTILVDFVAGLLIEGSSGRRRKGWLVLSLAANVGVLAVFKYWNFLASIGNGILDRAGNDAPIPLLGILLPIGLSFHTFQSMSYTIEVYRGAQRAERRLGIFALYVMFYPQLVAGPIERPQNLLHQFDEPHRFDYERATSGLKLMAWGLVKKMVVADRLAGMVNGVYAAPESANAVALFLATFLFAYQIYCDFSGYSDIARGSAEVMGFTFMKNFDRPYAARSLAEFWRRWHISLSTWFRDYVYFPLGGNRRGKWTAARNALVVFMISGLWHGASWNFVVWGALHGLASAVESLTSGRRRRALASLGVAEDSRGLDVLRHVTTFAFVCVTWVFFRAASLPAAITVLVRLVRGAGDLLRPEAIAEGVATLTAGTAIGTLALPLAFASVVALEGVQVLQARTGGLRAALARRPARARWAAYAVTIGVLIVFSQTSRASAFIYFQF